jgi:DNA uptake protein ComE-like DNA-binding protein
VNTATVAQLEALPGIGTVLAARIVAQRPYSSVADLHRVARIPAKVFPLVTV